MMSRCNLLKEKIALITGCNRGIGLAMLRSFASEGAIVYAAARKEGSLDEVAEKLAREYSTTVIPLYFDVTDNASMRSAFMQINKEHKRLDAVINNAGVMQDALIGMINDKLMEDIFTVNVFAVINMIQYAAKLMSRQKSGSIINISSIVGVNGNPGQMVYSASKGAVVALTKTAAKELAPNNIRVNAIAPGMIDTDMFRSIGEPHISERISKISMGRVGTPEEVASTAVFLASDFSKYITGQVIGVDGAALV